MKLKNMEEIRKGWVIANRRGITGEVYLSVETFQRTKTECINDFISGTNKNWRWWRLHYGYRCVKAEQTIRLLD